MTSHLKLGVIGLFSSGKDYFSDYLTAHYPADHISTSQALRDYTQSHGLGNLDRDNLAIIANQTRKQEGNDYFARVAYGLLDPKKEIWLVSGMRTIEEIDYLKAQGFKIVLINAKPEVRYQRALRRGKVGEDISFSYFKEQEDTELYSRLSTFSLARVLESYDYCIDNNGELEQFEKSIEALIGRLD
ncbi:AAA family ATPase [Candidatus Saccharibacteria bacterium]|nr:AAA family ATPase [Candidatus Saccharibacteria bacterium]MCB9834905.1 AAA family ATPase [Candidatus Nomurabacteria bacterium]